MVSLASHVGWPMKVTDDISFMCVQLNLVRIDFTYAMIIITDNGSMKVIKKRFHLNQNQESSSIYFFLSLTVSVVHFHERWSDLN